MHIRNFLIENDQINNNMFTSSLHKFFYVFRQPRRLESTFNYQYFRKMGY
jgi:hypothetical protein